MELVYNPRVENMQTPPIWSQKTCTQLQKWKNMQSVTRVGKRAVYTKCRKNLFDTKKGKHAIGNRRKKTCMQRQEPETMRDFFVTQVNPLTIWINTKIIFTNKTNNVLTSCCTTLSKNPTMKIKVTKNLILRLLKAVLYFSWTRFVLNKY